MENLRSPTDNWSLGSVCQPHFIAASGVTTGIMTPKRIYVLYNPSDAPNAFLFENLFYDPETALWISGAKIPTPRDDFAVAIVDDLIYVIGGLAITYPDMESWSTCGVTTMYATVEQNTPFGYGSIPPSVSIVSLQSMAKYASSDVPLNFNLNKPATWVGYSLDGKDNTTINANTNITGLSNGLHNITLYANDTFGNIGASETVAFTALQCLSPPLLRHQ